MQNRRILVSFNKAGIKKVCIVGSIANNLTNVIKSILGDTISEPTKNALVEQVFGITAALFVKYATPFFGLVSSGVKATQAWVSFAMNVSSSRKWSLIMVT